MSKMPAVSIVMVSYNGKQYLERSIPPLLDLEYPKYEILLVDNGSTDGTNEFIKKFSKVKYIISPVERSKNFAANYGVSKAKGEFILCMDNDLIITNNNILKELIDFYYTLDKPGAISVAYYNENETTTKGYGCFVSYYFSWEKPALPLNKIKYYNKMVIGTPNGGCFLIKRFHWELVGGYDAHLNFGGDDDDLGIKLWMMGYKNYLYANTMIIHIGMPERIDTEKWSYKFGQKVYAHMYTITKNFTLKNVIITYIGYSLFVLLKSVKNAICRKSLKPITQSIRGYIEFSKNIDVAVAKRKDIQARRIVMDDIVYKIRPHVQM